MEEAVWCGIHRRIFTMRFRYLFRIEWKWFYQMVPPWSAFLPAIRVCKACCHYFSCNGNQPHAKEDWQSEGTDEGDGFTASAGWPGCLYELKYRDYHCGHRSGNGVRGKPEICAVCGNGNRSICFRSSLYCTGKLSCRTYQNLAPSGEL